MLIKLCTWTAKSAPYPPCTVTALWLKYLDLARMLRRVTQPPHIAGPLVQMDQAKIDLPPYHDSFQNDEISFFFLDQCSFRSTAFKTSLSQNIVFRFFDKFLRRPICTQEIIVYPLVLTSLILCFIS
jgi:hypothetical protein